jgi:hypothetical protein
MSIGSPPDSGATTSGGLPSPRGGVHAPLVRPPTFSPRRTVSRQLLNRRRYSDEERDRSRRTGIGSLDALVHIRGNGHGSFRCVRSRSRSRAMNRTHHACGPTRQPRAAAEHHSLESPTSHGCICALNMPRVPDRAYPGKDHQTRGPLRSQAPSPWAVNTVTRRTLASVV